WALYERILQDQVKTKNRSHKGAPLVFISDCFLQLGFPVHAKRYLMLALCEDALQEKGEIDPHKHAAYFRLFCQHRHTDAEVRQYVRDAYDRAQKIRLRPAFFPRLSCRTSRMIGSLRSRHQARLRAIGSTPFMRDTCWSDLEREPDRRWNH